MPIGITRAKREGMIERMAYSDAREAKRQEIEQARLQRQQQSQLGSLATHQRQLQASGIESAASERQLIDLAGRFGFPASRAKVGMDGSIFLRDMAGGEYMVPKEQASDWLAMTSKMPRRTGNADYLAERRFQHQLEKDEEAKRNREEKSNLQRERFGKNYDLRVREFEAKMKKEEEYLKLAKEKAGSSFSIENARKYSMVLSERNKAFERWKALSKAAFNKEISQDEADAAYDEYKRIDAAAEELKRGMDMPQVAPPAPEPQQPAETGGFLSRFVDRFIRKPKSPQEITPNTMSMLERGQSTQAQQPAPVAEVRPPKESYYDALGYAVNSGYMQQNNRGKFAQQFADVIALNKAWEATGRPINEAPHILMAKQTARRILATKESKAAASLEDLNWAKAMEREEAKAQATKVAKVMGKVPTKLDVERAIARVGEDEQKIADYLKKEGFVLD